MKCIECIFWKALLKKNKANGNWEDLFDEGGYFRLGWCTKGHPIKTQEHGSKDYEGRAIWPKTKEDEVCGEFIPIVTELQWMINEKNRWFWACYRTQKKLQAVKKMQKNIIKAVKIKYPKIRLNDRAIEMVVKIIQEHEVKELSPRGA